MATRATYSILRNKSRYNFYIHYDGYPDGAATYFAAMLNNSKGHVTPESFIRANKRAELTEYTHGDTEFHYDLEEATVDEPAMISVKERNFADDHGWRHVKSCPLASFLNEHQRLMPEKDIWLSHGRATMSKSMALDRMGELQRELESYKKKFPDHSGNIHWQTEQVKQQEELLARFEKMSALARKRRSR